MVSGFGIFIEAFDVDRYLPKARRIQQCELSEMEEISSHGADEGEGEYEHSMIRIE